MNSSQTFDTINPASGETLSSYAYDDRSSVELALARLHNSQWGGLTVQQRAERLKTLQSLLLQNTTKLAELMTKEMGKPILESEAEVKKSVWLIEHYSEHSVRMLMDQSVKTTAAKSYVSFQPMGVILGIMPWNFPLWQVVRFAIPTLVVGNRVLIKHADNVAGSAELIEKIFHEAGFVNEYKNIRLPKESVASLISHKAISGVSLTGSVRAGRAVAEIAGRELKKCVLELGGSDAYIVLADADLELASDECIKARFVNSGQSCVAAKRWIVEAPVYEAFLELVLQKIKSLKVGPMARHDLLEELERQVGASVKEGARLMCGGKRADRAGYFYEPTLLADVTSEMTSFKEEIFGPVASLIKASDREHAIALANDSDFGLGGAIFSRDVNRAELVARNQIESGSVFVNEMMKSSPLLPFGGIKHSGIGREMGFYGMLEFANLKVVSVASNLR